MSDTTSKDIDRYTKEELKKMIEAKEEIERQREAEKKSKIRKRKLADWLVPFIVAANIVFASVIIFIFARTGLEPSTLISNWFRFTGIELVAMAGIKITDTISEGFGGNR